VPRGRDIDDAYQHGVFLVKETGGRCICFKVILLVWQRIRKSQNMSELWKKVQKSLLGRDRGGGRRRCHEANPSQHRIASGRLPTDDELTDFETSYAGSQTVELMEGHSGEFHFDTVVSSVLTSHSLVRRYSKAQQDVSHLSQVDPTNLRGPALREMPTRHAC